MSMEYCHKCDQLIDTDFNAEHFDEHDTDITKGIIGLEGLVLSEVMPSLQAYALQTGQGYKTGSDYSTEYLNRTLEELTA